MTTAAGVPQLDDSTKLAFDRTWLAEERTMLAWVRTATSLITFGFAIYSFFGMPSGAGHSMATHRGPQIFSVALIAIGLIALIGAAAQRRRALRVASAKYPTRSRFSLAECIAGLLGFLGLFALVSLLTRL